MSRIALFAGALILAGSVFAQTPVGSHAEINGMQMYYEVSGEGDPLIVLHGAYMNIPSMGDIIPMLAEKLIQLEHEPMAWADEVEKGETPKGMFD